MYKQYFSARRRVWNCSRERTRERRFSIRKSIYIVWYNSLSIFISFSSSSRIDDNRRERTDDTSQINRPFAIRRPPTVCSLICT